MENEKDAKRPKLVESTDSSESRNKGEDEDDSNNGFALASLDSSSFIKVPKNDHSSVSPRLIVLLDAACLETVKVGREFQLLNCDDHQGILKKAKREIGEARPDIAHQCLLTLLDSPLNKAGLLRVYIKTTQNILISINPQIRIPRTFKRFAGLMVQLLHKLYIKSSEGGEKLMNVIKNPITDHLPPCKKIGTSHSAKKIVEINDYVATNFKSEPVVFVIGCFAHGKITEEIVDETISYSNYPLSASVACGKLACAFEKHWSVL